MNECPYCHSDDTHAMVVIDEKTTEFVCEECGCGFMVMSEGV